MGDEARTPFGRPTDCHGWWWLWQGVIGTQKPPAVVLGPISIGVGHSSSRSNRFSFHFCSDSKSTLLSSELNWHLLFFCVLLLMTTHRKLPTFVQRRNLPLDKTEQHQKPTGKMFIPHERKRQQNEPMNNTELSESKYWMSARMRAAGIVPLGMGH